MAKQDSIRAKNCRSMARAYATPDGRKRLKANATRWRTSENGRARISEAEARRRRADPVKAMYRSLAGRAKRANISFELSLECVRELTAGMVCSATGLPLSWEWSGPGKNPWAPSVDRLEPHLGYVESNIRITCWAYNLARSNWSDEIVRVLARGVVSHG